MRLEGVKPPEPGHAVRVQGEGGPIAVFNVDGKLYGVDARCSHVGGPIDQGRLDGTVVTCPWHGSQFELNSGTVVRGPAVKPLHAYRARADGTALIVEPV